MQLGIDLGSRTIKLAVLRDGNLVESRVVESTYEPHRQAQEMLGQYAGLPVVATGYGRHLAHKHFARSVITEIRAHALGARHLVPECRTILDVGGQDSKVISLDAAGKVQQFQMNDKCAAGTGRFLEMMAATLGYSLGEFAGAAASGQAVPISSMCAVFAESEVVSLKNRGTPPEHIAHAVHLAVVDRLAAMLERVGVHGELVFSGGVANNAFLVAALERRLGQSVTVPPCPDVVGAIGAALYGV